MSEEKEMKYSLAIKLKQIDRDGSKPQEPSDDKWGVRQEYFSTHRADVRKLKWDVSNRIYRALDNCVTYGGKTRNVKASILRRALKYEELERLCTFPRKKNSAGTRYFMITHSLKYSNYADDVKTVFQINNLVSNHNYLNNALVIDLDELKKLFCEIKEDWEKETILLKYQSDNELRVKKILDKAHRLDLAVKEGVKKLDDLRDYDENIVLTSDVLDMYHLSNTKQFLKTLGGDYIESSWQAWDNIDKVNRDIQIYQNKITYNYTDYMHLDYDISLSGLQQVKEYIELTHEDNEFPQIENRHSYNNVLKCYDKVNTDSLPKIDEYYRSVMELEELKIKIEQQKATMIRRMLLFLKPKGDVVLWGKK